MTLKDRVNTFLSRYSLSTHSFVVLSTILVNSYFEVPTVHDYVYGLFLHFPNALKGLVVTLVAWIGWYWRGRRTWTPEQRVQKAPITGSAPPGTSAGGDSPETINPKLAPQEVTIVPWVRH
jgi:hypothetical protein